MKVYISGAITNNPQYKEQFAAAEEILVAAGHTVVNPAKNHGNSYREYINVGLFELMQCDAIYLLRGYERSTGATLEHDYARTVGLEIMKEYPDVIGVDDVLLNIQTGKKCVVTEIIEETDDKWCRVMYSNRTCIGTSIENIMQYFTPTGEKLNISHELKKLDWGERPAAALKEGQAWQ